ncbi:MAG: hypothetical protein KGK01_12785 [Bradyrhizobium sp.]|uniref:hypothetical protein n=1 Tax=Bradyrhizobium sp. TaxID=376 RepID=UPI001C281ECE|nr:hypothetical protein [Bradyrhizobium sp.]MBU6462246.1 hypothetical protein [Pseudomonadota bacterium]MDE2067299.1 hypothetical protein [Bradyrhizobium sp.]MDE2243274.1 hypothetical protein [Bradyrhizobium sp.]MDE2471951.1 hypothetical protein [Bradyrhizobium sp.]
MAAKPRPGTLGFVFGGLQAGAGVLLFFAAGGFRNPYMPIVALFATIAFWLPALLFITLATIELCQFLVREQNRIRTLEDST